MEGIINFGPNVASFLLASGSRRQYVVGAYVPPNDAPSIHHIEHVLGVYMNGMEVTLLEDLNESLMELRYVREEDLVTALAEKGLVNMTYYFMTRRRYRGAGSWIWQMIQESRQVTGRGD